MLINQYLWWCTSSWFNNSFARISKLLCFDYCCSCLQNNNVPSNVCSICVALQWSVNWIHSGGCYFRFSWFKDEKPNICKVTSDRNIAYLLPNMFRITCSRSCAELHNECNFNMDILQIYQTNDFAKANWQNIELCCLHFQFVYNLSILPSRL